MVFHKVSTLDGQLTTLHGPRNPLDTHWPNGYSSRSLKTSNKSRTHPEIVELYFTVFTTLPHFWNSTTTIILHMVSRVSNTPNDHIIIRYGLQNFLLRLVPTYPKTIQLCLTVSKATMSQTYSVTTDLFLFHGHQNIPLHQNPHWLW